MDATTSHLGPAAHAGQHQGRRWLPFRARQVLSPQDGFVWAGRAAWLIAGSDRYLDGDGAFGWHRFGARSPATPASAA